MHTKISNEIENLLYLFGHFHDACLVRVAIETGYSVDENLTMHIPYTQTCTVTMLFQRQYAPLRSVELVFSQVIQFQFLPAQEGYDRIIEHATMCYRNGVFYWADMHPWTPGDAEEDVCWIAAKRVKWREVQFSGANELQ